MEDVWQILVLIWNIEMAGVYEIYLVSVELLVLAPKGHVNRVINNENTQRLTY